MGILDAATEADRSKKGGFLLYYIVWAWLQLEPPENRKPRGLMEALASVPSVVKLLDNTQSILTASLGAWLEDFCKKTSVDK